jgi:predicted MarR family transcription regulator
MEKTIKKAKTIRDKGKAIDILLMHKKDIEDRIKELNDIKFFTKTDLTFDYTNSAGSCSSIHVYNYIANIGFTRESQILGEEIVNKLNEINAKCIFDIVETTKTQLQIKIEVIDFLIKKLTK